jgi:hypothetical protein
MYVCACASICSTYEIYKIHYNIAQQKGIEMKTKRIYVRYIIKFVCYTFYWFSMRELWVAGQITYLYSVSVYTFLSKYRVSVAKASLILGAISVKVVDKGGTYTAC